MPIYASLRPGNTVSDLTGPRFKTQTFRSRDERVTARPTGRFGCANNLKNMLRVYLFFKQWITYKLCAGTNNARLAQMLRNLAVYYSKDPSNLFLVRLVQGLVHLGKVNILKFDLS